MTEGERNLKVIPTNIGTTRSTPTATPLVAISDWGRNLGCSRLCGRFSLFCHFNTCSGFGTTHHKIHTSHIGWADKIEKRNATQEKTTDRTLNWVFDLITSKSWIQNFAILSKGKKKKKTCAQLHTTKRTFSFPGKYT